MKHASIEDELGDIESDLNIIGVLTLRQSWALADTVRRLLQTLDGHNTAARADVAAILGVDDLKPKLGPQ